MSDTTDTDDEVEQLLRYIDETATLVDFEEGLIGNPSDLTVEELPEGAIRDAFITERAHNGVPVGVESLAETLRLADHVWAAEDVALHLATKDIDTHVEQGTSRSRATELVCQDLPDRLAKDLVRVELDIAQSSTYDHPDAFEEELGLRRLEADLYGPSRNYDARLTLWDEMLGFTLYHHEVTHTDPDTGEERESTRQYWTQSSAEAHNRHLRHLKRTNPDFDFTSATTTPVRRYFPDWDPLPDVQDFVLWPGEDN